MSISRTINSAKKSLAKQWNSVFDLGDAANRKSLWSYVCSKRALDDPSACLRAVVPKDVEVNHEVIQGYLTELAQCDALRVSLRNHQHVAGKQLQLPSLSDPLNAVTLFCYVATRLLKPATVIETGCATGWMSALFLLALHHNQRGHLFSVDLPPMAGQGSMEWTLPEGLQVGFLVPQEWRSRWTLTLGNARTELIPLLEKVGSVDIFCHDSDHTYTHMMWEYTSAWPYLARGGLLVSDDIGWNTAFWDFATAISRACIVHRSNTNVGALSKV